MNVRKFTAPTAREALALVREALGDDAVVLSTRPAPGGVEVVALAPEGLAHLEQAAAKAPVTRATPSAPQIIHASGTRPSSLAERIAARGERLEPTMEPSLAGAGRGDAGRKVSHDFGRSPEVTTPGRGRSQGEPQFDASVARDVETLGMSTLTFQDYVRERMLKRRQAEMDSQAPASLPEAMAAEIHRPAPGQSPSLRVVASEGRRAERAMERSVERHAVAPEPIPALRQRVGAARHDVPVLRDEIRFDDGPGLQKGLGQIDTASSATSNSPRERTELMGEIRSVRDLIEERFGMLAFMERLQRDPRQAGLSQKLFDTGLSPALVRKLVQSLPSAANDELAWAAGVLERNVVTDEHDAPIEDHDGVLALIGPTGVGKTTSTAKIAAAFATKHGAASLGLITLDAYRVAAHEQLRTYGRILGVPVHTAHDRASLEDLLELLSSKKLVLIDTAGMAQRDARTREMLDMLAHPSIKKVLVLNAAAQGETVEDVMVAYGVSQCLGVIVSKLDEAVKLGPALDALIRHKAKVLGVANGQRVPEDWHRLSAQALVQRAMRGGGGASWRLDAGEVNLLFAATQGAGYPGPQGTPTQAASLSI
jgi:flagellar biosynthesis protein FlhF